MASAILLGARDLSGLRALAAILLIVNSALIAKCRHEAVDFCNN